MKGKTGDGDAVEIPAQAPLVGFEDLPNAFIYRGSLVVVEDPEIGGKVAPCKATTGTDRTGAGESVCAIASPKMFVWRIPNGVNVVRELSDEDLGRHPLTLVKTDVVRFSHVSEEVRIAYVTQGSGPVMVAGMPTGPCPTVTPSATATR